MEITLITDEISELRFREIAGLCVECGKHWSQPDRKICELCQQAQQSEAMQRRWANWGIAA